MATHPAWADNAHCRALIAALLLDPPATYVRSAGDWHHGAERRFQAFGCKPLARLRRAYREWFERQLHILDQQFHVSGHWDDGDSRALHQVEDADALLRRLLDEQQGEREAA